MLLSIRLLYYYFNEILNSLTGLICNVYDFLRFDAPVRCIISIRAPDVHAAAVVRIKFNPSRRR